MERKFKAIWGGNFHATLVEGSGYPWRCLCFIDLNRAGEEGATIREDG